MFRDHGAIVDDGEGLVVDDAALAAGGNAGGVVAVDSLDAVAVKVDHGCAEVVPFGVSHARLAVDLAAGLESGNEECTDCISGWSRKGNMCSSNRDSTGS